MTPKLRDPKLDGYPLGVYFQQLVLLSSALCVDSKRIVRRFLAKGLFTISEETLDQAAGLLDEIKEALRSEDHATGDEKKDSLGPLLTDLSTKLHHVFVRMRKYDVDFEPKDKNKVLVEDLGKKLHVAEAVLQRLANFVLHPEKYSPGDFHGHVEAAWNLAHEAFRDVHSAYVAAKALQPL